MNLLHTEQAFRIAKALSNIGGPYDLWEDPHCVVLADQLVRRLAHADFVITAALPAGQE